jgi:hypothetical protein
MTTHTKPGLNFYLQNWESILKNAEIFLN